MDRQIGNAIRNVDVEGMTETSILTKEELIENWDVVMAYQSDNKTIRKMAFTDLESNNITALDRYQVADVLNAKVSTIYIGFLDRNKGKGAGTLKSFRCFLSGQWPMYSRESAYTIEDTIAISLMNRESEYYLEYSPSFDKIGIIVWNDGLTGDLVDTVVDTILDFSTNTTLSDMSVMVAGSMSNSNNQLKFLSNLLTMISK